MYSCTRMRTLCGSMLLATTAFLGGASAAAQAGLVGDVNGDGVIDFRDIDPFVAVLGAAYKTHVGPTAWYPFDGNTDDYSGSANHGSIQGGVTFDAGFVGQAAVLDGTGGAVKLDEPLNFAGRDYTIAFWMRVAPAAAQQVSYILHATDAAGQDALTISLNEAADSLCVAQGAERLAVVPSALVCDGGWHHVALTRKFATMQVDGWLDGLLHWSGAFTAPETTSERTWIGGAVNAVPPSRWFAGELDALAVFDRVIAPQEVARLALPQWRQRTTPGAPAGRHAHGMAYDASRGVTVLFAGANLGGAFNDTWEWDGRRWVAVSAATNPEARSDFAIAYDEARERVVIFGGRRGNGTALGDTWELYDGQWHPVPAPNSPAARHGCSMVYDATRQRLVLFGGRNTSNTYYADTWAYDGNNWTNLNPGAGPSARAGHGMAYDAARDQIVVFGGEAGSPLQAQGDTWVFDGTTNAWIPKPGSGPAARYAIGTMTYDPDRQLVLLFGNNDVGDPPPHYYRDMWVWNGANWQPWPVLGPAAGSDGTLVYDAARKTLVLVGGFPAVEATWEASLGR